MTREASSAIVSAIEAELDISPRRVDLATREDDGVSVTLLWTPATNLLAVVVVDSRRCESFELVIEPTDRPLEIFYHPYSAAAARGVDLARSALTTAAV
jgi:hypothetical protein